MNEVGVYVLESALQNAQEDLARAREQLKKGGPSFDNMMHLRFVAMYERMVKELTEAVEEAKGNGYTETTIGTQSVS